MSDQSSLNEPPLALDLSNISKSYGNTVAVKDLSFSLGQGEILAFIGPNGAGKTSTVRMILDLITPDSGDIKILGRSLDGPLKNQIGYLPEERGLYRDSTVEECIQYFGELKNLSRSVLRSRVSEWLERLDLAEHKDKKISELSRGMQQKTQFIATLIHKPKLLIVDEPFAALDPVITKQIKKILVDAASEGAAVLLCTHQMHLVEELADRLVMINKGSLVLSGTPREVREKFVTGNILLSGQGDLSGLDNSIVVEELERANSYRVRVGETLQSKVVLSAIIEQTSFEIESFEIEKDTLEDIFLKTVRTCKG